MDTRRLGRTGHHSSVAILGGACFWDAGPAQAADGLDLAVARGVNHLDIAPAYGAAEAVVGEAWRAGRGGGRAHWFIGCKTGRSSRDGARAQLERSLELLGTDTFDLYQLHGVTDLEELDRRAGAVEALLAARDEGLVRCIGITGHDLGAPAAHREAVLRYDLDTVMFPCYPRVWADPVYRADAEALLATCAERDVGAMVIKAVARRPWGAKPASPSPWYEPQTTLEGIARGVRFALSTPGVTGFCTPGSLELLPAVLDAAEAFVSLDEAGRSAAMAAMSDEPLIFPLAEHIRR